jgi:Tol biopolymer transport system component
MWGKRGPLVVGASVVAFFALVWAPPSARPQALPRPDKASSDFADPKLVTVHGYSGDAAEPFISPDGSYLLFNNGYGSTVHTVLMYATADGDGTFTYKGQLTGANDPSALSAVASLADDGTMYFISNRSYPSTLSTTYMSKFSDGSATAVKLVPGISAPGIGTVDFDSSVSADDNSLYVSVGTYQGSSSIPSTASIALYDRGATGFVLDPNTKKLLAAVNKKNTLTYAADISSDDKELFYTQLRLPSGQPSIYSATRSKLTQPFGHVQRVTAATGFVEAPSVSSDGRTLYFHKVVAGHYEIYEATRS